MSAPRRLILATTLFALGIVSCRPQNFFYCPNSHLYNDPDRLHIPCQVVSYPSLNGRKLYALFFPTAKTPRGTIVHFHGNFGNVSNHFPLALFLVDQGFDVLSFDYQGYGASEGHPSMTRTIEDGIASVRYAEAHRRVAGTGVGVFGQSIGGAIAIVVAAREKEVRAAVIESAFSSYRRMGRYAISHHIVTWPLYALVPFVGTSVDPIRFVADISPRPVFFIHGDADAIVPAQMSRDLYAAAKEPKRLWIVAGANHLGSHRVAGQTYVDDISAFFAQALSTNTTKTN